jgi:hypothetical protein
MIANTDPRVQSWPLFNPSCASALDCQLMRALLAGLLLSIEVESQAAGEI